MNDIGGPLGGPLGGPGGIMPILNVLAAKSIGLAFGSLKSVPAMIIIAQLKNNPIVDMRMTSSVRDARRHCEIALNDGW